MVCENHRKKVSFNIASEASYVYILSGQNFFKKCQNFDILKPAVCGQSVLPDSSILLGQILMENAKIGCLGFLKTEGCG